MLWSGEGLTSHCTIIDTQLQVTVKARLRLVGLLFKIMNLIVLISRLEVCFCLFKHFE